MHLTGQQSQAINDGGDALSDLAVQIRSDVLRILTEHINRSGEWLSWWL